ncbi:MAG TPA: hypothetical protein QF533_02730 [Nitrospinota bacterium]|nr:hypothetical protein [Nitrospinota bacterium]
MIFGAAPRHVMPSLACKAEPGEKIFSGWTPDFEGAAPWVGAAAWGVASWGALALALTLAGVLGRIIYNELRGRVEQVGATLRRQFEATEAELRGRVVRAEGRIDEIHLRYARRDDITRELEAIRKSFAEVFSELRRANEGIAALRGGSAEE